MVSCPAMYYSVGVRILPSLRQKRVAKSVKSGIRIGFDFITQPSRLGFQDTRLEFFVWMKGLAEYVPALRFRDQLFEDLAQVPGITVELLRSPGTRLLESCKQRGTAARSTVAVSAGRCVLSRLGRLSPRRSKKAGTLVPDLTPTWPEASSSHNPG